MKLKITVKPNARRDEVVRNGDGTLLVRVNAPPVEGKANERVIELLSEFLQKPKRSISIISGFKGKNKIVEIK
jgi:uncharacterized protein (TIGR00251 family)